MSLEVSEALITNVTKRMKARVVLHIGASHRIILKLKLNCSDMTNFGINCSIKKSKCEFGGIRGINHPCYNYG